MISKAYRDKLEELVNIARQLEINIHRTVEVYNSNAGRHISKAVHYISETLEYLKSELNEKM